MSKLKNKLRKKGSSRHAPRLLSKFSSDGEVELRGDKVYLHGRLAEELEDFSRQHGMTLQAAFLAIVRCGLPLVLAEHRIRKLVQKLKAASHKGEKRVKKLRGRSINR